jgi:predicted RNase H-like HicB family nuclease
MTGGILSLQKGVIDSLSTSPNLIVLLLQESPTMMSHQAPSTASSNKQGSRNEDFMRYAIVIEKAENNYSAYVPDLPGCIATGTTIQETEELIREAIEFHLTGLREDGVPIPQPSSQVEYVDVTG